MTAELETSYLHRQLSGPSDPGPDSGWVDAPPRKGFFTDTSICIGCKACEVACKEWNMLPMDNLGLTGESYDNTGALGSNTWRHVAFVEQGPAQIERARESGRQLVELGMPTLRAPQKQEEQEEQAYAAGPAPTADLPDFRWLMSSDVCKHCTHAGCLDVCPTGALFRTEFGTVVVQDDICNGCGYCVPACPFGVVELAELPATDGPQSQWQLTEGGIVRGLPQLDTINSSSGTLAHKCTLCYDRLVDGIEPACAKACPTDSIQFGDLDELRARATRRVADLQARGVDSAYLYGAHEGDPGSTGHIGPLGAFFLLLDRPEVYNLPSRPQLPQNNVLPGYVATALTALALGVGAALAFRRR
jgi:formate dehydrogenase iron-sulfur subunit